MHYVTVCNLWCLCGVMVNTPAFDEIDPESGSSPTNTIVFMTYMAPSGEWNLVVKAAVRYLLISSYIIMLVPEPIV